MMQQVGWVLSTSVTSDAYLRRHFLGLQAALPAVLSLLQAIPSFANFLSGDCKKQKRCFTRENWHTLFFALMCIAFQCYTC
jgi:hypothetical protein